MQPFLFHSLNPGRPLMQPVLLTAGAPAAFATTVRPPLAAVAMKPELQSQLLPPLPPPVPQPPPVELYLCGTNQTATGLSNWSRHSRLTVSYFPVHDTVGNLWFVLCTTITSFIHTSQEVVTPIHTVLGLQSVTFLILTVTV